MQLVVRQALELAESKTLFKFQSLFLLFQHTCKKLVELVWTGTQVKHSCTLICVILRQTPMSSQLVGWLILGLTALWDSISVYIGPSPKEREKEERKDRCE